MRLYNFFLPFFLIIAYLPAYAQKLDSILTKNDRVIYQGHIITRSAKSGADAWTITIKKNGKILDEFEIGDTMSKDWAKLGLFSFLGARRKQLFVKGYSGGAHCCWEYRIIDFLPSYHTVFNSQDWKAGDELTLADLDHDGVFEFSLHVMTFDYFPISHAEASFPPVIFKYNPGERRYLPANRRFPARVTKGLGTSLATVTRMNQGSDLEKIAPVEKSQYVSAAIDVFLRYLYSGLEKKAWEFFENNYKLDDKQEIMLGIKQKLRDCPIYNHLYHRGR